MIGSDDIRRRLQSGGGIEPILTDLKERGCTPIKVIKLLVATGNFTLKTAKAALHSSESWRSSLSKVEEFHEEFEFWLSTRQRLRELIGFLSENAPAHDVKEIERYLERQEHAVAFSKLITAFVEAKVPLGARELSRLSEIASDIGSEEELERSGLEVSSGDEC